MFYDFLHQEYANKDGTIFPERTADDYILFHSTFGYDRKKWEDLFYIKRQLDHSILYFVRRSSSYDCREIITKDYQIIDNAIYDKIFLDIQNYSTHLIDNKTNHFDPKYSRESYSLSVKRNDQHLAFGWNHWNMSPDVIYFMRPEKSDTSYNHTFEIAKALYPLFKNIKHLKPLIRILESEEIAKNILYSFFLSTVENYAPNYLIDKVNYIKVNGQSLDIKEKSFGEISLPKEIDIYKMHIEISTTENSGERVLYEMN